MIVSGLQCFGSFWLVDEGHACSLRDVLARPYIAASSSFVVPKLEVTETLLRLHMEPNEEGTCSFMQLLSERSRLYKYMQYQPTIH